ncbi:MAG: hypothetical protein Q7S19_00650 [bacterium]|nr:hypothetical protein [bacterium]
MAKRLKVYLWILNDPNKTIFRDLIRRIVVYFARRGEVRILVENSDSVELEFSGYFSGQDGDFIILDKLGIYNESSVALSFVEMNELRCYAPSY